MKSQPARTAGPRGVVSVRSALGGRFNAWRKRTPFNPYWIEAAWLRRAGERLAPHAAGRLLDVGVGEKPYGALFLPRVERYVGLEYPPVADNLYPQIWQELHKIRGIVDVFGDGQRMPFAGGVFDTVVCVEVLEHVPDPAACLQEIARVLRPGGRLLLTVPFSAPLHQLPYDYLRWTPRGIEALLARGGFEVESLEPRGNFASAAGAMLSHFLVRTLAARRTHRDGSVELSRWRAPLVLPLVAAVQVLFALAERFNSDETLCLGYIVVCRAVSDAAGHASEPGVSGGQPKE